MEWAADLGTATFGLFVCAVGGLLVPRIVERVPEPEPDPEVAEVAEVAETAEGQTVAAEPRFEGSTAEEPPKELYAEIAALPWLRWASVLLGAVSGFVIGLGVGWDWGLLVAVPLVPVATALAVIDARTRLLPSWLVWRAYLLVAVLALVATLITQEWSDLRRAATGLVIAYLFYEFLWMIYRRGMGYGDVRLSGLLGLTMAYFGWPQFIVGMYICFPLFVVPGLGVALVRWDRKFLKTAYPFGPSMIVGALIGIAFGTPILAALVGV
jgi:leader peptidase (prepilin peptidase)/N-methyltransferase